jgi:hypothetical protein
MSSQLDKYKELQQKLQHTNSDDILSSLVYTAQSEAKLIYRAKNEIFAHYKFKRWFKPSKKRLQCIINSVVYTTGSKPLDEEVSLLKVSPQLLPVPWMGVDRKNLDYGETIMIDIDSESTHLPVFCKTLIIHQVC